MLNTITIMGRLTREPELRNTQSGIPVASFTVACERDYAQGEQKETDFIDVVAWRKTGEFVKNYFGKGQMIIVSGRLQMRKWTDRNGANRVSAEILADRVHFGESKKTAQEPQQATYQQQPAYQPQPAYHQQPQGNYRPAENAVPVTYDQADFTDYLDSELPF